MKNLQQIRTTLIGLFALVLPILVVIGWISPEKQGPLGEAVPEVINAIFVLIGSVAGLWAIFKTNDDG
jgi:hypothetical protein